jgi:hypothetical protein
MRNVTFLRGLAVPNVIPLLVIRWQIASRTSAARASSHSSTARASFITHAEDAS